MANTPPLLLVEDDENDAFFFQRAMGKAGLTVPLRVARTAREAIEYIAGTGIYSDRTEFPLPSLVVLDLNLGAQTGFDVLHFIRQRSPHPLVPVIVLTSSTSDRDVADAYRAGANSFLRKPSELGPLSAVLGAMKEYWFGYNRWPPT
jgi:CheY-like chemotaxis protein